MGVLFVSLDLDIIKLLDGLREQRGLTLEEFTTGVVSRRNYSRYLTGEIKMSSIILTKLLEKMHLSLADFSYYVQNVNLVNYGYEITFFEFVTKKDYQKAKQIYSEKIKGKPLYTYLSETAVPAAVIILKWQLKEINIRTARRDLKQIINLSTLLNRHIYTDDIIGAIDMYSLVAEKSELEKIKQFLIDFLIKEKRRTFFIQNEISLYLAHTMFLRILTSFDSVDDNLKNLIAVATTKALDFDRRARIDFYNIAILEILYGYANKMNLADRDLYVFYYLSALFSLEGDEIAKNKTFKVIKSDYELFLKQIEDEKMLNLELYEGLINNDYL